MSNGSKVALNCVHVKKANEKQQLFGERAQRSAQLEGDRRSTEVGKRKVSRSGAKEAIQLLMSLLCDCSTVTLR
jgi:hypothetical protein